MPGFAALRGKGSHLLQPQVLTVQNGSESPNGSWWAPSLTRGRGKGYLPIRSKKERLISKLAAQLKLLQKAKALPLIPAG